MGSLPLPPNIGAPQQGNPGYYNPQAPTGTLPYNTTASVLTGGINDFVTKFLAAKEGKMAQNDRLFEAAIQAKMQGLTPSMDDEKIMKIAQKSHYGKFLKTEAPSQEEQQYTQQVDAAKQASMVMQPLGSGGPGPGAMPGADMSMPQMVPGAQMAQMPAPPQPPPQPGFWDKLKFAMGSRPPVSMQSPLGQYLSQLGQAGQVGGSMTPAQVAQGGQLQNAKQIVEMLGLDASKMNTQTAMQIAGVVQSAIHGNQEALGTAHRLRVMDQLDTDKISQIIRLAYPGWSDSQVNEATGRMSMYNLGGGPALRVKAMDIASNPSMVSRFAGKFNDSLAYTLGTIMGIDQGHLPQPTRTPEEWHQIYQANSELRKGAEGTYPEATLRLAFLGVMPGGEAFMPAAAQELNDSVRRSGGPMPLQELAVKKREAGARELEAATGVGRLKYDWDSLAQHIDLAKQNLNYEKWKAMGYLGKEFAQMYWNMSQGAATSTESSEFRTMLADQLTRTGSIPMEINGKKFTITDKADLDWYISPTSWRMGMAPSSIKAAQPPEAMISAWMSQQTDKGKVAQVQNFLQKYPEASGALWKIWESASQVPAVAKNAYIDSLTLPPEMKALAKMGPTKQSLADAAPPPAQALTVP